MTRRGIRIRVIDKLPEPTTESRAIAIHVVATGVKSTAMRMLSNGSELFHVEFGGVDSALPFSLLTSQTETERVLDERLSGLGVTVDRGVELVELTQEADGVQLTLFKGERFILGDCDCDADSDMDAESMYTVFAPEGPVIMMPMRDGRARLMAEIHDERGAALNLHPTQDALQKISTSGSAASPSRAAAGSPASKSTTARCPPTDMAECSSPAMPRAGKA
ncbi:FAD-dependent monooxygenase [Mycobacterium sp. URHB0021]